MGAIEEASSRVLLYTSASIRLYNVNKRYCYGELRQGLNLVYRLFRGKIFRGYEYGYNQYGTFFSRNFAGITTVFAYVTIA